MNEVRIQENYYGDLESRSVYVCRNHLFEAIKAVKRARNTESVQIFRGNNETCTYCTKRKL
jgi:hypothetical protein